MLVIIAADALGHKDIVGNGYRESAQSWKELLLDLKVEAGPELAVGDGALGFWKALGEVYGQLEQRCWENAQPDAQEPARQRQRPSPDIWMAETKADAEQALISSSRPTARNTTRPSNA